MRNWAKSICFGRFGLLVPMGLVAQVHMTITDGFTPPGVEAGTPNGSYPLTGLDTVDHFSGKLNFRLPLVTVKDRGEAAFTPKTAVDRPCKEQLP